MSSGGEETVIGNTENFIDRYWWVYRRLYGFKIWTAGNGVCRFIENGVIRLYNSIKAAIRQKYSILLDEEDIDNIILERGGCYKPELKERVREVAIGYVTELLGKFRELGIDFNTTQTVFLGGGSILMADFIQIVWKRFGGEYSVINDTKANAKGYRLQYLVEKRRNVNE